MGLLRLARQRLDKRRQGAGRLRVDGGVPIILTVLLRGLRGVLDPPCDRVMLAPIPQPAGAALVDVHRPIEC